VTQSTLAAVDVADVHARLYADGICPLPRAFPPEFADQLHESCLRLHDRAASYPQGRISRGRNRWYFAVHPEEIAGIADILAHPWLRDICTAELGPDYQVAETAFDISLPGSRYQPPHRDFRQAIGMRSDGNLTALAFNIPTVDVTPERGPLEVMLGTQNDVIDTDNGMFPEGEQKAFYENHPRLTPMHPVRGGMSVRTPLALHRGTPNVSDTPRPVMVVTVYAGDVDLLAGHDVLAATEGFHRSLPPAVRDHLHCEVVPELPRLEQKHDIEGLVMGDE
jgi:hypothetical protein